VLYANLTRGLELPAEDGAHVMVLPYTPLQHARLFKGGRSDASGAPTQSFPSSSGGTSPVGRAGEGRRDRTRPPRHSAPGGVASATRGAPRKACSRSRILRWEAIAAIG
jgi:hypothetical protein